MPTEISRRHALRRAAGTLVAAGAAQSLAAPAFAQQRPATGATFVLVPGSWHGAWCYRRVAATLAARGHTAHALTLTGLADRSHLAGDAVNMTTHVKDVANFVKWEGLNGIVLVGHSYGGLVITGAAEEIGPQVASIVYLDAFIPENGQSMADIVNRPLPATGFAQPFTANLMNVNANDQAWVDAKMTPHPIGTYHEKMTLTGAYKRIPKKTYVRATGFSQPVFQKHYEHLKQQPDWQTFAMNCGHDVMVDQPDELADILVKVA
jgi:pimeloyl-ACP methyl ester carboxylesterase